MTRSLAGLFFLLCAARSTAVQAQSPGQPVTPGQVFAGSLLSVRAPDSEGWVFAPAGNSGLAFARRGAERNETYAAQAFLFKLIPTEGREEFLKLIRERVDMVNPPSRFEPVETHFEFTEQRGYPCARYKSLYNDKEALTTSGTREPMKLQVVSLFCRHPSQQEVGFFAAYSHRGANTDPDLDVPAQQFIDGVQVPQPGRN